MRLIFLVLLFPFFYPSHVLAQDTIVLKNGLKKRAQVVSVDKEVVFKVPPSDTLRAYYLYEVNYIKYADGSIYTLTRADSIASAQGKNTGTSGKVFAPYLLVSAGGSFPFLTGYGAASAQYYNYYNTYSDQYVGDASNGLDYSITGGVKLTRGWEIMGMYSYYQHQFDASAFLNENANIFLQDVYIPGGGYTTIYDASTTNTYYFKNSSFLIGVAKNWGSPHVQFGINIMAGQLITNLPAMQGYGYMQGYTNGVYYASEYYLNTDSKQINEFMYELGVHVDVTVFSHLMIRAAADIQISSTDLGTNYHVLDMNGNVITSGTFGQYANVSTSMFVGLGNVTIGVGYEL